MNIEKWLNQQKQYWLELDEIVFKISKNQFKDLANDKIRRFSPLYMVTAQDLARARAIGISANVENYLNNLVIKSHNQIYSGKPQHKINILNYLWFDYPKLFVGYARYINIAFLIFCCGFGFGYINIQTNNDFANAYIVQGKPILPSEVKQLINEHKMWTQSIQGFESYSSAFIATNNIRVSILLYILGLSFGIGTAWILWLNGLSIGVVIGYCAKHDMLLNILSFIASHGIFELLAFYIAGAAGLSLGYALINPGQYKRIDSLKLVAIDSVKIFCGVIPLLICAGIIEGFISPQSRIENSVKYIISLTTLALFLLFIFIPRNKQSVG